MADPAPSEPVPESVLTPAETEESWSKPALVIAGMALFMGVLIGFLIIVFRGMDRPSEELADENLVVLIVAARDLPKGEVFDESDIEAKPVDKSFLDSVPDVLRRDDIEYWTGRILKEPVAKGQAIKPELFGGRATAEDNPTIGTDPSGAGD